jgi:hypothetical protein
MDRRTFCGVGAATAVVGCGASEMPQEFTLQPSPIRTAHLGQSPVPGYATGLWTPSLTFAVPGNLSITYNEQSGYWTRVGNFVICSFNLLTAVFTHTTASGNALFSGFPLTPHQLTGEGSSISTLRFAGITKANYTQFCVSLGHSSTPTLALIRASAQGQTTGIVTASDMPTGGVVILDGMLIYPVAAA